MIDIEKAKKDYIKDRLKKLKLSKQLSESFKFQFHRYFQLAEEPATDRCAEYQEIKDIKEILKENSGLLTKLTISENISWYEYFIYRKDWPLLVKSDERKIIYYIRK